MLTVPLTLLHSEWPKLCGVMAVLSAIGLSCNDTGLTIYIKFALLWIYKGKVLNNRSLETVKDLEIVLGSFIGLYYPWFQHNQSTSTQVRDTR